MFPLAPLGERAGVRGFCHSLLQHLINIEARCPVAHLKNPIFVFMLETEEALPSRMKQVLLKWLEPRQASLTKKPPGLDTENADPMQV
jgi:hypothetical protein